VSSSSGDEARARPRSQLTVTRARLAEEGAVVEARRQLSQDFKEARGRTDTAEVKRRRERGE
jgi:hypothetical protein